MEDFATDNDKVDNIDHSIEYSQEIASEANERGHYEETPLLSFKS